ncbi:MAG TPA: tetratricopeptide repeat protein [Candidatus Obscuribacterales bacterium]
MDVQAVEHDFEQEQRRWKALNDAGHEAYGRRKHVVAEEKFKEALDLAEKWGKTESLKDRQDVRGWLALSLNNLGALYQAQGKYGLAEEMYQRSLKMKQELFGEDHKEVAPALQNLASVLCARSHFLAAEPMFRKALAIKEREFGAFDKELLITLKNYSLALKRLQRDAEAAALDERIEKIEGLNLQAK